MASVPFNNLITFSRGSNATLTGSNGLIQYAPNNLVAFSEQFNDAAWTKAGTTVSANTTVAPDGTTTADKQVEDTSTGDHRIFNNIAATVTASATYTWSVYAKAAERTSVRVTNNSLIGATFNLTDGTFSDVSGGITAASTSVGNGWYRLIITGLAATSSERIAVYLVSGGATSYTGNGTSGAFIWGAQLELGSTATTYNPTTVKNLLGFSEAFDNAAWTKTNSSIVTGAQANPVNAAFNAQKLMEDTANTTHQLLFGGSGTVGSVETMSIYAKPAGRNWLSMQLGVGKSAYFDLSSGALGNVVGGTASTVNVGNGWYRCSFTATRAGNTNNFIYVASANGVTSYTGDGNSGVYIYGAQLSDSASLDAYVPTPGAAPTSTAYYGPRFDYDPVTLAPKGILVEEARTNLLTYSEQFDNVVYVKDNTTVTANAVVSPDGATTADNVLENTANAIHRINQGFTATISVVYTASMYVKPVGNRRLYINTQALLGAGALFDFVGSGSVISVTGAAANRTASITPVGNGWYRCSVVGTGTSVAANVYAQINTSASTTAGDESYLGNGTSGLSLWGWQLEAGAFATSYIPTVASTVTRSGDIATITGSLFSQWYGQTQGTFILEMSLVALGEFTRFFEAADATFNTRKPLLLMNSSNQYIMQFRDNGVDQASPVVGVMAANMVMRLSAAYKTNDFAGTLNGGTPATDTSGIVTTAVDRLFIGSGGSAPSDQISCHIRYAAYYPVRLADFQLQALSELPLVPTLDLDFLNNLYEA